MFRSTKCVRTFLKGCDILARGISGMHDGRVAYVGEVTGISSTGCDCGEAKARNCGDTQLKSPISTRSNRSYLNLCKFMSYQSIVLRLLIEAELLEWQQVLFFRFPYTVHYVLDVQYEVRLTVACITKWHVWRIRLRNWCQRKVRRPCLNQHHVARYQACSICSTPWICPAPEYDSSIIVGWIAQDLVEDDGKPVQVTDVQRTEVGMERIVEEGVIDGEVHWGRAAGIRCSRSLLCSWRLLMRWSFCLGRVWKGSILAGGMSVGCKVQTIYADIALVIVALCVQPRRVPLMYSMTWP